VAIRADKDDGTLLCGFYRAYRERFLPTFLPMSRMRGKGGVSISSLTSWASDLDRPRGVREEGSGFIIVRPFDEDTLEAPKEKRIIIFNIVRGRVDPDGVYVRAT
jgi:hypothetical protein